MKKRWKAMALTALALCAAALLPVFASARDWSSEQWTEVGSWDELKAALEKPETLNIRLTKGITHERNSGSKPIRYAATVAGTKVLDLNGHDIYFDDCSNHDREPSRTVVAGCEATLFRIPKDARFTISDSKEDGKIYTSAYFTGEKNDGLSGDWSFFTHDCTRDIAEVEGWLCITGGYFQAGASKKQFLRLPLSVDDKSVSAGRECYQVIYGSVADVKEGGTFISLGGRYDGHGPGNGVFDVKKGAAVYFYDGLVCGQCSANCFNVETGAVMEVYSGTFETYCHNKIRKPDKVGSYVFGISDEELQTVLKGVSGLYMDPYAAMSGAVIRHYIMTCDYGRIGIPKEAFVGQATVNQNMKDYYEASFKGNTYVSPNSLHRTSVRTADTRDCEIDYSLGSSRKAVFYELCGKIGKAQSLQEFTPYYPDELAELWPDEEPHVVTSYEWYVSDTKGKDLTKYTFVGRTALPELDIKTAVDTMTSLGQKVTPGKTYYLACKMYQVWDSRHSYVLTNTSRLQLAFTVADSTKLISGAETSLYGASIKENEIVSDKVLWDIGLTSKTEGVASVEVKWYENGRYVEDLYGGTGWQQNKLKNVSRYRGLVILTAKEEYCFSPDAAVTVDGKAAKRIDLSDDRKELRVWTPEWTTNCDHVWRVTETTASCTKEGIDKCVCQKCGAVKEEKRAALGHLTSVNGKDVKWTEGAESHYQLCVRCGQKVKESSHSFVTTSITATCTQKVEERKCTVCGAVDIRSYPVSGNHKWSSELSYDSSSHWRVCTECGTADTKTAHNFYSFNGCKGCRDCEFREWKNPSPVLFISPDTVCIHQKMTLNLDNISAADAANIRAGKYSIEWQVGGSGNIAARNVLSYQCNAGQLGQYTLPGEIYTYTEIFCFVTSPDYSFAQSPAAILVSPMYHVQGYPATCTAEGLVDHYICSCGKKVDKNGNILNSVVIPKTGHQYSNDCDTTCNTCGAVRTITHDFSSDWSRAEGVHFHLCRRCGAASEAVSCSPSEWIEERPASAGQPGYRYIKCTVCGQKLAEMTYEADPEQDSSHDIYINELSFGCSEVKVGDPLSALVLTAGDSRYSAAGLEFADKQEAFSCAENNTVRIRVAAAEGYRFAVPEGAAVINGSPAGVGISRVSGSEDKELLLLYSVGLEHEEEFRLEQPGCTAEGKKELYCTLCGTVLDTEVLPALGHVLNRVEAISGSCISEGEQAYFLCEICGKMFADAEAKTVMNDNIGTKDPNNHVGGSLEYDETHHWTKCACGAVLDKEAHSYGADKVCTVCGYKKGEALPYQTPSQEGGEEGSRGGSLLWLWLLLLLLLLIAAIILVLRLLKKDKEPEQKPAEPREEEKEE